MRAGVALALSVAVVACGSPVEPAPIAASPRASQADQDPGASPSPSLSPSPDPSPSPGPSPSPSPLPTPVLVAAPLTGRLVTPEVAARRPIAVMIDDQAAARPQSGFTDASVVWQAPAEGGIPRYMLVFQEGDPPSIGPVRSARQYYIDWAAEWRAVYVHVGGSPQALATLAAKGAGQLVWNADEVRWGWGGHFLWRITQRPSPHNVYTSGARLLELAAAVGATDEPLAASWTFAPDAPIADRPSGGSIAFDYPQNAIRYTYDRSTNSYLRSVTGEQPQVDAGTGAPVAPRNVVIMLMRFGPLNDAQPEKKRLEAEDVGSGPAWIATDGRTIAGTWRKDSVTAPTRFYDGAGAPATLTIGQTFVQVVQTGTKVTIVDGTPPPAPRPPGAPRPD